MIYILQFIMQKKLNYLLFFSYILSFFGLYACGTYSLKLNGQKGIVEKCLDNEIEFKAMGIRGTTCVLSVKGLKGEIECNTDSLNITTYPDNYFHTWFSCDGEEIFGHQVIKKSKTLKCYISYGRYGSFVPRTEQILIPPNNFIMCDGKPLITDTIRISLK